MDERIQELASELIERKNFHTLHKDINHILHKHRIISKHDNVKCVIINKDKPRFCTVGCKISAKDTPLNEDITIMIKPDHTQHHQDHRCLKVVIQVGNDFYIKIEDKDDGRPAVIVYKREYRRLKRDINSYFDKEEYYLDRVV